MQLTAIELPYADDALAPYLSGETLQYHYGKHYLGYVRKLAEAIAGTPYEDMNLTEIVCSATDEPFFNNAAQAWNHEFYWHSMAPSGTAVLDDSLGGAVRRDFGSIESLEKTFKQAAISVFGSGWAWLVRAPSGRLEVVTTKDADCPLREGKQPLLTCDVWEHAYYLDYENHRSRYVDAWWNLANWEFAAANFHRHDVVITR